MGLKKQKKLMAGAVPTIRPAERKLAVASEAGKIGSEERATGRMWLLQSSDKRPRTSIKAVHKLES